jgi:hypothetical protein
MELSAGVEGPCEEEGWLVVRCSSGQVIGTVDNVLLGLLVKSMWMLWLSVCAGGLSHVDASAFPDTADQMGALESRLDLFVVIALEPLSSQISWFANFFKKRTKLLQWLQEQRALQTCLLVSIFYQSLILCQPPPPMFGSLCLALCDGHLYKGESEGLTLLSKVRRTVKS